MLRVAPNQLDQLLHPVFDVASLRALPKIATGIAASPAQPLAASPSRQKMPWTMSATRPVILLRKETTPDDIHGMDVAKGILTAVGGASSHAAVVARGMGRPCIVGAGAIEIDEHKKRARVGRQEARQKATGFRSTAPPAKFTSARPRPKNRIRTRPSSPSS